jgi:hypothetical protein
MCSFRCVADYVKDKNDILEAQNKKEKILEESAKKNWKLFEFNSAKT